MSFLCLNKDKPEEVGGSVAKSSVFKNIKKTNSKVSSNMVISEVLKNIVDDCTILPSFSCSIKDFKFKLLKTLGVNKILYWKA